MPIAIPIPKPMPESSGVPRGTEEGDRRITEEGEQRNTQDNIDSPVE